MPSVRAAGGTSITDSKYGESDVTILSRCEHFTPTLCGLANMPHPQHPVPGSSLPNVPSGAEWFGCCSNPRRLERRNGGGLSSSLEFTLLAYGPSYVWWSLWGTLSYHPHAWGHLHSRGDGDSGHHPGNNGDVRFTGCSGCELHPFTWKLSSSVGWYHWGERPIHTLPGWWCCGSDGDDSSGGHHSGGGSCGRHPSRLSGYSGHNEFPLSHTLGWLSFTSYDSHGWLGWCGRHGWWRCLHTSSSDRVCPPPHLVLSWQRLPTVYVSPRSSLWGTVGKGERDHDGRAHPDRDQGRPHVL